MTAPRFHIRTATLNDVAELNRLIEVSVRVLQRNDYTAAQIEGALGHALGLDTQLIVDATYFVAAPIEQPELIAGCGGWSFRKTLFGSNHGPDRAPARLDPQKDPARIRAIFVHPDWARQGLGSLLLHHCESAARDAGFHRFELGSTLTGVPLYLLKGYKRLKTVDVPLPNGEIVPVVQMAKEASPFPPV
ncbi:MAG: GNAT family N-acetyltransferase [Terracidiphilus sp.]